MIEESLYVCMECGHEWESKESHCCPNCGCGNFAKDELERNDDLLTK